MNDIPRQNNLELLNDLTRDEIMETCDIAYSNSMNGSNTKEAARDHQIDQIISSDILIPSKSVIENSDITDDTVFLSR